MRRRLLIGAALLLVGVPLLLLGAAALIFSTDGGQRWLAARVVAQVNPRIAGRVALERAALGLDGVRLEGVRIWAPGAAEPAVEAGSLYVAPAITAALLQGRVRIHDALLEEARVLVESPADGGLPGIARAFQPRDPAPPARDAGDEGGGGWEILVDRIAIERSALVVRTVGAPPQVDLDGLSLELRGRVDADGVRADGSLTARLHAPVQGPAAVEIGATLGGGYRSLQVRRLEGRIGGSTIAFHGNAALDSLAAEIPSLQMRLLPADVPGLVAGWSPTVPLRLEGSARFASGTLATKLEVVQEAPGAPAPPPDDAIARADAKDALPASDRPVAGDPDAPPAPRHLRIDAELQPVAGTWRLDLRGAALDPHGFDARAPAGAIDLGLALEGAGLDQADGTIELPAVELGGGRAGPIRIAGSFREERLEFRSLSATLAGGSLEASGWSGAERADLRFDLDARNARQLLREVERIAAGAGAELPALPAITGAARIDGRVQGPFAAPAVVARIRSPDLTVAGSRLVGLDGDVDLAGPPTKPSGKVSLRLERAALGSTRIDAVTADLHLGGTRLRGTVDGRTVAGRIRADLDVEGRRAWQELAVGRLDLRWPRAAWSLASPARLVLADGITVEGLALRSDHGARIDGSGSLRASGALALDLRAAGVDLGRLPPALAPAELGLAGTASLSAKLGGTVGRPKGEVQLALADGALGGVEGIALDTWLLLDGKTVEAKLRGGHGGAQLEATATAAWPIAPRGRFGLDGRLTGLDLAELVRLLALDEALAGSVAAELSLEGSLDDPRGTVEIRGSALAARGVELTAARIGAVLGEEIRIEADAAGGAGTVEGAVTFALSPAALRRHPEALLAAPLQGRVQAKGLELARLAAAGGADPLALRGSVDVDAALTGSIRAPRGTATLQLVDAWNGEVGPLDATLVLAAQDGGTELRVDSKILGKRFLAGSLGVAAALEQLGDPEALRHTALRGEVAARSLELAAAAWAFGFRGETAGTVEGTLRLAGTTGAPRIDLDAQVADLALGGVAFGEVALDASYEGRKLGAAVALRGASGGEASLRGAWPVDLAIPAVAGGSLAALAEAPLDLAFKATALDLAFLEGLSPDLRQAEGKLDGTVQVVGKLPLPTFEGALALRDGRFGYTGYGDVREIALEVELRPEVIRLRRMSAEAGGTITASGAATRGGPGEPYAIDLQLDSKRFALTTDDLVRGWLDARAQVTGSAGLEGVDARLAIERAAIELADTPSKAVQSLDPHPDFVVVRGGMAPLRAIHKRVKAVRRRDDGGYPIALAIASERPVRIEGTDVQLTAGADLSIVVLDGSPQFAGTISVEKGHVMVMSRRFEFARGRVYYTGAEAPGDPRLDVVVRHESQHALVTVTVGGTVQKPTTNLRSNPPYSEAQIAELLATGRLQGRVGAAGAAGAGGAASALGAVLTTQLKKGIAAKLPLDVISFQAGDDETLVDGSRLEAGSYLSDRLYLGYARRFEVTSGPEEDEKNLNEVRLEYQLAPRWTLEMTYGDANVGGADLVWSRDF
ncbi:translocation/assembly module TamB domain-containing protein [Vulgatibacter sp.]|uniref:translocation/assembly module TamB domain-containing protein n=1 Tax=Vulgatibacter sp. TaxID=1971226 RepID=UPI003565E27E